jgi:flagella basal body P-ring formation protein FlgA
MTNCRQTEPPNTTPGVLPDGGLDVRRWFLMRGSERHMKAFPGAAISLAALAFLSRCFLLLALLCYAPVGLAVEVANPHYVPELTDRIQASVQAHVRQSLGVLTTSETQLSVDILGIPGLSSVDTDFADVPITLSATSGLKDHYSNRTVIQLNLCDAQNHCRHLSVPVKITLRQPVWVAKLGVPAHQPLGRKDLALEVRDVSQIAAHTLNAKAKLDQYETRVSLAPGEVVDTRKLLAKPDVRRNAPIRVILAQTNGVEIGLYGKALQDGRIGDIIVVTYGLNQSTHQYRGEIIGPNAVKVSM